MVARNVFSHRPPASYTGKGHNAAAELQRARVAPNDFQREFKRRAGQWLRDMRLAAGMTQQDLAEAIGLTSFKSVSAIEIGERFLTPERYEHTAKVLGVDLEEFARTQLKYENPYLYLLFEFGRGDRALRREVEAVPVRGLR